MKFKTKLYVGFGVLFGLFIISHFVIMIMMNQLNDKMTNVVKNYEMLNLANNIKESLLDYSMESRGIMANPPEELRGNFTKNMNEARDRVNAAIETLEKMDNGERSEELIQQLKRLNTPYFENAKETDALIKEGKIKEANRLYWYEGRGMREGMIEIADEIQTIRKQTVDKELSNSSKTYYLVNQMIVVFTIVGFLVGLGMIVWILRSITGNLNKVTSVMTKVSFEESDQLPRIEVVSKDEIGDIAVAFNEMAQALETHTMQEKQLKEAAEEQSWLKTKAAEMANMYPGIDDLETLARLFITKAAPIAGANYGIFYMKQQRGGEERLWKLAAYADHQPGTGKESFQIGEGIVGQCALENRMISLDQVPKEYITIQSGLGMAPPAHILVIPAEFQGEVLAVIELASFKEFSPLQQKFLEEIMGHIGVNINSILRHMKVEKLLEESQMLTEELQSQSEELQLQQEELRTVNEQLEEQYEQSEQKTKELESIKNILEEKAQQLTISSQYKSEFLANMSHELRTPLNSLLILAQMLADNAEGNLTPKQVEYAGTIFSSGNDLLHLINDILDLAKVEAGKMDVVFEDVKINDVKAFVQSQFAPIARRKQLQLHMQCAPDLPETIRTDKQRLQQILKNLLSNAFKFTEQGTVSLTIEMVQSEHSGAELAFVVRDTGIGISQEKQAVIFEAFKQADGTISRKYGGTGLGLSISREMAHLLGGFIEVESIERSGSTFTLYLPNDKNIKEVEHSLYEMEAAAGIVNDSSDLVNDSVKLSLPLGEKERKQLFDRKTLLQGKKILIVDDDMRNIFSLTAALERYQVEVVFAENGREGIEALQKNPEIDLILMDIMMPEMNGFQAIQEIRQIPEFQSLPIIALTAKAMKNDRKQCIEAGASDYISKPINVEQLFSIVQVWLYK
ncbi:response regulator [Bacillus sp. B190/17]|uniref:histidine kinase n=1 Tax=Bacillus lumedeiriae TaxID=3058829 RepID=A0ABW8I3R5_9BACI